MRSNFLIILILLNLLTFYALYQINSSSKHLHNSPTNQILPLPLSEINSISFSGPLLPNPITIEKNQNQWFITKPFLWPVNFFTLQKILVQLQFTSPEVSFSSSELPSSGQSLDNYGLSSPQLSLSLSSPKLSQSLSFGKPTQSTHHIYALNPEKNNILVLKQSFLDSLLSNINELKSTEIFSIPIFDLQSFTIQTTSPHNLKIRFIKKNNTWEIESPINAKANSPLVENTLNQLLSLHTSSFISSNSPDLTQFNLTTPPILITLQSHSSQQTLLLGNPSKSDSSPPSYFAKLEDYPTIFTIPSDLIDALTRSHETLRDKNILSLDPSSLSRLTFSQSNSSLSLQKLENNQWSIISTSPTNQIKSFQPDPSVIQNTIQFLTNLQALSFVSEAPSQSDLDQFGLSDPQRTLTIESPSSSTTLLLGTAEPTSNNIFAKLQNSPTVYTLPPSILPYSSLDPLHFASKIISEFPTSQIHSVKLLSLSSNHPIWQFSYNNIQDPSSLPSPSPESTLLSLLSKLSAHSILPFPFSQEKASIDSSTHFPWSLKLQILSSPSSDPIEIFFTNRISGNLQIAGFPSKNITFTLPLNWIDFLDSITTTPPSTE